MNCCSECFKDTHIRNIVASKSVIGECSYCSHKDVAVFDIAETPNPIADVIIGLVQIYSVSDLPDAKPLSVALHEDWNIFNSDAAMIQRLVVDICSSVIDSESDIYTKQVIIPQLHDADFLKKFGVVRGLSWKRFAESIRYKNRFHSEMFNAEAFMSFLRITVKAYPAGVEFYRARIAKAKNGFKLTEMGPPPKDLRPAGRINPEGIGVLYLSSDDETVLNEVRASTFDYISIGKFKSSRAINVVNLSGLSAASPFIYQIGESDDELARYAANRNVFQEIALEIAKPLRRSDSPIEYLPTQYIAEFIKSQGYDGVEYASTLREGGYNIAIFDETLFECVSVNTVEISKIQYEIR
jgi:hypothetical protein